MTYFPVALDVLVVKLQLLACRIQINSIITVFSLKVAKHSVAILTTSISQVNWVNKINLRIKIEHAENTQKL